MNKMYTKILIVFLFCATLNNAKPFTSQQMIARDRLFRIYNNSDDQLMIPLRDHVDNNFPIVDQNDHINGTFPFVNLNDDIIRKAKREANMMIAGAMVVGSIGALVGYYSLPSSWEFSTDHASSNAKIGAGLAELLYLYVLKTRLERE